MIFAIGIIAFVLGFIVTYTQLPKILDFVIQNSQKRGFFNGPWKTHLGVGLKHTSRIEKAAIARIGLGGNSSEETVYWNVFTDSNGETLFTSNEYEIIINQALPVAFKNKGFWSITAYGEDQFLMETSQNKYMVESRDMMDISFPQKIILSKEDALPHKNCISLSKKPQKFTLALRCYRPNARMKTYAKCREITLPIIRKIG